MKVESVNALAAAIKNENLLKKYNLEKTGVFGSFARGETAHDIDIFIDTEKLDLKSLIHFKKDLERITDREIDIMVKHMQIQLFYIALRGICNMLHNENNDLLYLLNILDHIGKIWKYTEKMNSAEELFEFNEQMNLNASLTLLANIGENVSKIICEKIRNNIFDLQELDIAKSSKYYKYIDFEELYE
jgi:predicted nucleotidyltransferase